MEVIVKKCGNSAAVRIPASVMVVAHVVLDLSVGVREEQGRIVIEPVRRKAYELDKLLGGITGKNQHKSIDTGALVGKEVWQWRARKATPKGKASTEELDEVRAKIAALLETGSK